MLAKTKYANFLLLQPVVSFKYNDSMTTRVFFVVHFPPDMRRCSYRPQRAREERGSRFSASNTSPTLYFIYTDSDDLLEVAPSTDASSRSLILRQWLLLNRYADEIYPLHLER